MTRFPVVVFGLASVLLVWAACGVARGADKTETFDVDPGWDGRNNRPTAPPVTVRQDFGFSNTANAGGKHGEIGGHITPAAEPAYYAIPIEPKSFNDVLGASGRFTVGKGGAPETAKAVHILLGFFNSDK